MQPHSQEAKVASFTLDSHSFTGSAFYTLYGMYLIFELWIIFIEEEGLPEQIRTEYTIGIQVVR